MEERLSELIILLASGINQRRMYFDNHPNVQAISQKFFKKLYPILNEPDQDNFTIGVYSSKFIRGGKFLVGPSIAGRSLIEFAENLCCGGFVFRLPLNPDDMLSFFRLGAELKDPFKDLSAARDFFSSQGLAHVELCGPYSTGSVNSNGTYSESSDETDFMAADFAPLLNIYQTLYETVANNNLAIHDDDRVDLNQARVNGRELVAVSNKGALDVMQFMRYPDFDSYTIGHSVRVAALGALIARQLGWSIELQGEIATAGLLHDLGKGKVPDEILFKAGRLSDDEMQIMEKHSVVGVKVLLANGETSPIVLSAAYCHHIKESGQGYPVMPSWFKRSSAAALVHVCDVFEALTAARPYKNPMCPRKAYEIMMKDKGAFQPRMLAALIRTLGLYPPGSEVMLSDQRRAVVVAKGINPDLPLVRVTHDESGNPITRKDQPAIHLDKEPEIRVDDFLAVGLQANEINDSLGSNHELPPATDQRQLIKT